MLRRPSFLRVLLVLDATVVVLVGMRLAAPILFAVVLSLLFGPLYAWVERRGVPTPVALVIMLVGPDHPQVARLTAVGQGVVRQFGLRAILDLVTAVGVTVLLLLLGVDFPLMWGILTFFLSFVPYIGLVLAVAPAVLLAAAEFGKGGLCSS